MLAVLCPLSRTHINGGLHLTNGLTVLLLLFFHLLQKQVRPQDVKKHEKVNQD